MTRCRAANRNHRPGRARIIGVSDLTLTSCQSFFAYQPAPARLIDRESGNPHRVQAGPERIHRARGDGYPAVCREEDIARCRGYRAIRGDPQDIPGVNVGSAVTQALPGVVRPDTVRGQSGRVGQPRVVTSTASNQREPGLDADCMSSIADLAIRGQAGVGLGVMLIR